MPLGSIPSTKKIKRIKNRTGGVARRKNAPGLNPQYRKKKKKKKKERKDTKVLRYIMYGNDR